MSKLDRNRPFGEVMGGSSHRYEQDGKRFNGAGEEIVFSAPVIDPAEGSGVKVTSGVVTSKPKGKKHVAS